MLDITAQNKKHNFFSQVSSTDVAEKIAIYSLRAFNSETPNSLKKIATQALVDQYGLQIGGSEFAWSQSIYQYVKKYSAVHGHSTITRYGDSISPTHAAFINGCFAHAQDFDDSHQEAQTHPGSVVIPAAVAIGEHLNLSGRLILKAIIIGMEIMLRLAHSLCPACIENGHHTPPTIGQFGSAIACGLLLNLDLKQLTNALGICGSYAGGLVEYTLSGGSVKRIHTGIAARAGLEAALLAKEGLTGPSTIIEGEKGLWAVFGRNNEHPERLFDQIGKKHMLQSIMFKPYNCCYLIHPAIEAFLTICKASNLHANDIKAVTVGLSRFSVSHAGKIIVPKDELGAQFSTSFTLALSLVKEAPGMWSYTKETLCNRNIVELAKKISVYEDHEISMEFPKKNGSIVNVTTKSNKNYTLKVNTPKGSPGNQLTPQEVKDKFLRNTLPIIGDEKAAELYEIILRFDELEDLSLLSDKFTNNNRAHQISAKL